MQETKAENFTYFGILINLITYVINLNSIPDKHILKTKQLFTENLNQWNGF